ncbi:MAG: hypothetical protein AAFY02_03215 [Pseudomonadota bacterium]
MDKVIERRMTGRMRPTAAQAKAVESSAVRCGRLLLVGRGGLEALVVTALAVLVALRVLG